jgi:hypothetical protein
MFKNYFENKPEPVWDTILFVGKYNPITKSDWQRIKLFKNGFIPKNKEKFKDKIHVGLLTDVDGTANDNDRNSDLTYEERNFISTKFWGLRMYQINLTELIWTLNTDSLKNDFYNQAETFSKFLINYFNKSNILIVIDDNYPTNKHNLKKISEVLSVGEVKVGFVSFNTPENNAESNYYNDIPINCEFIKAACLLDLEKPDPLYLKDFCAKHKLLNHLNKIKSIHFKCRNENYRDLFKELIPPVTTNELQKGEENILVLFEILKNMYKNRNL